MKINWKIDQLERQTESGGVIIAHWRVSAEEKGEDSTFLTASTYGSVGFTPDPESENFIPFEQLTEEDVLNWIWNQKDFDRESIEENLSQQIEQQKNPPTELGLPWN